jgi:cytochrome c oxidase cbb3-type subunit 3
MEGWRQGKYIRAALLGLLSTTALHAQQPSPPSGAAIFASNCATCHGADGRGGEHAPNIATTPEVQHLADRDLAGIVKNGIPGAGMPAFSSLNPQQVGEVVGYLRMLQGRGDIVKLPGNSARGEALFFGKAKCSDCHMVHGKGGFIGSELSFYGAGATPEQIRAIILDPEKNLPPQKKATTVVTLDGQKLTGMLKANDNFSLSLQTLDGVFHFLPRSELAQIDIGSRSLMPAASTLSGKEVDDLVSYLLHRATEKPSSQPSKADDDDDN